jgi:hypothetical protein
MIAQVRAVCREVDVLERRCMEKQQEIDQRARFHEACVLLRSIGRPAGKKGVERILRVRDRRGELQRMELNG